MNKTSAKRAVKRSPAGPRRRSLIHRLEALLEKQVIQLETGENEHGPDKEISLLGTLARTLEKLIELDEKQASPTAKRKTENAEMTRLRSKLTDRIRSLESE